MSDATTQELGAVRTTKLDEAIDFFLFEGAPVHETYSECKARIERRLSLLSCDMRQTILMRIAGPRCEV